MQAVWLIDGNSHGAIAPDDRGLAYGDGLFETIAARDGAMPHFDLHYTRLARGCQRLGIPCPDAQQLQQDIAALAPGHGRQVVKIIVTRGSGGRGYRPPADAASRRLVGIFPWPDYPAARSHDGIDVISCSTRLGENPALAGMKHLCRLENVIAQTEVEQAGAHEGLMRSIGGAVICGTMSNLFVATAGKLLTPRVNRCGIAGITRARVLAAADELGIVSAQRVLRVQDIEQADELFVCNSIFGIWPIRRLDGVARSIGKLTQSLQSHLFVSQAP